MTTNENPDIFREDWLACLCAHYLHTLRIGDLSNAEGLRRVLIEAGIDETDIDTMAFNAGFVLPTQSVEVELTPPTEEPDQPPVLAVPAMEAVAESDELPEIAPQMADEPAMPRDLFSLLPADDTTPAESAPAIEPFPPPQPSMLPLPLTDAATIDDLSSLIDQLRPKPRPPKQRSLF